MGGNPKADGVLVGRLDAVYCDMFDGGGGGIPEK